MCTNSRGLFPERVHTFKPVQSHQAGSFLGQKSAISTNTVSAEISDMQPVETAQSKVLKLDHGHFVDVY